MNCYECKYMKSREIIKIREKYLKEYYCENRIVVEKFTNIQKELSKEISAFDPFLAAVYIPRPDRKNCPYFERREEK
ncbi:MAG: hypothetical protein JXM74_11165 [Fusobacteriaceae bacterium]|nr:hypothetical protein [Fusobacteriaceae bacterium]